MVGEGILARSKAISDRAEIIRTGMEILEKEGIKALSIRRIGSGLNVSGMTLYNYIENIDEVKREIILEGFRKLYKEGYASLLAVKRHGKAISTEEGCKALAEVLYDFGINHSHLFQLMFCSHEGRFRKDAEIAPFYGFFHNHLYKPKGNNGNDEHNRALNMLDNISNGLIHEHIIGVGSYSREAFIAYINEFVNKMFKQG